MNLWQRFFKILPLVLVIALIPLLVEWGTKKREVSLTEEQIADLPEADLRITGGRFLELEGDRVVGRIDSKSAQLFEKKNYAQLEEIDASFFQEDGREVKLRGKTGKLELDSKNLNVHGDVNVISSDGVTLKTQSLRWNDSAQKLTSQDWVEIEHDKMRVTGRGLDADLQFSSLKIKEDVTSYLN